MMEQNEFQAGDIVRLVGGGCHYTVTAATKYRVVCKDPLGNEEAFKASELKLFRRLTRKDEG